MAIVKVGWSGGKDSTCAVCKHIERGDKVKAVCYIPMFTKEIPLISRDHYNFIINTAAYFRGLGVEVFFANGGLTYWEYVTRVALSGKNKGQIFGFPWYARGQCGFKRDGKLRACSKCDIGAYDYESVGIAYDEVARQSQLSESKRSILCELKLTQQDTADFCREKGLLSPLYIHGKRDGCALCFNAKEEERQRWFNDYPQAVPLVIELQNIVKEQRPDRPPLRGYRYFIDD